ncbi:hypothetical protein EI969_04410 [Pseudomonas sp. PB101]|nr:hypothetical protein [Pseudomonas sp. PB101]
MTPTQWRRSHQTAKSVPCQAPQTTVGASLLAMAACQSTSLLNVMASSRASSLPQGVVLIF